MTALLNRHRLNKTSWRHITLRPRHTVHLVAPRCPGQSTLFQLHYNESLFRALKLFSSLPFCQSYIICHSDPFFWRNDLCGTKPVASPVLFSECNGQSGKGVCPRIQGQHELRGTPLTIEQAILLDFFFFLCTFYLCLKCLICVGNDITKENVF